MFSPAFYAREISPKAALAKAGLAEWSLKYHILTVEVRGLEVPSLMEAAVGMVQSNTSDATPSSEQNCPLWPSEGATTQGMTNMIF